MNLGSGELEGRNNRLIAFISLELFGVVRVNNMHSEDLFTGCGSGKRQNGSKFRGSQDSLR